MNKDRQAARARAAIESGVLHVNVSIGLADGITVDQMVQALRSPTETLSRNDRRAGALTAFIQETEETRLARFPHGGDASSQDLQHAAELILRPSDEKLDWTNYRGRQLAVVVNDTPRPPKSAS